MLSAKSFFPAAAGVIVLFAAIRPGNGQTADPTSRPESRIHDDANVFQSADRALMAGKIRERLDSLHSETGCDVLIATVTAATGTSPRLLADQFAATWLKSNQRGAVLVYERAGNRLAISATQSVRDLVADYSFSAIEQSLSGDREDTPPAEVISLAAGDLAALLRKNFGEDSDRQHPSIKADRILFGAVIACIIALIAVVAVLHWRGEKVRA